MSLYAATLVPSEVYSSVVRLALVGASLSQVAVGASSASLTIQPMTNAWVTATIGPVVLGARANVASCSAARVMCSPLMSCSLVGIASSQCQYF